MTEQTHDHPLGANAAPPSQLTQPGLAEAATATAASGSALANLFTLDQVLSAAKRPERTVPMCVDGVAEREYQDALLELAKLVDEEGEVVPADGGDEPTMDELRAARDAKQVVVEKRSVVLSKTVPFLVRAMPSDDYETWDKTFERDPSGRVKAKDQRRYENELIASCAVRPEMDVAGVEKLRKAFGQAQMIALWNHVFYVNTRDAGLDIPFSRPSLLGPAPKEQ